MSEADDRALVELTAEIVSAYVSNNQLSAGELPGLVRDVHEALSGLSGDREGADQQAAAQQAEPEPARAPAVPVNASVRDDAITCLECGKSFKTLKRHLSSEHGLDPAAYRERWHLSKDYPLVAPAYSRSRAKTAKSIGLGRKGGRRKNG
ncbi:transcriptional regulator, MucR family [Meinhardsimonia xiamenensis]|jgi:predicted transcriptional regulator|uniref:Transcriptional regulator, MucR family n=1 Tax=Meinhardsimonia xiamenensis TaxID=990712 RepID=A0A1G9E5S5_9RHOB|nr:MucR family transcriptional regulator [Meinhardsimonia xiamenensis]PRX33915.1 MucR family transcriptional regulator [Meinhardsimonia xiamenensis]SDK71440.1 transcriptional regulator, MucR family [Meinhardsimonia xiamenensis]